MIKDLISNIIQNYRGNISEGSQNNPDHNTIGDKFDTLLKLIHKESLKSSFNAKQYISFEDDMSKKNESMNLVGFDLEQQPIKYEEDKEQLLHKLYETQLEINFEDYSIKAEDGMGLSEKISSNNKELDTKLQNEVEYHHKEHVNIQRIHKLLSDEQGLLVTRNESAIKAENENVENDITDQSSTQQVTEHKGIATEILKNRILTNHAASIDRPYNASNQDVSNSIMQEVSKFEVSSKDQKINNQSRNEQSIKSEFYEVNNAKKTMFTSQSIFLKQENKINYSDRFVGETKIENLFFNSIAKQKILTTSELESLKGIEKSQHSVELSKSKNAELIQLIQCNKSEIIKPKQIKNFRDIFPETQLSQTRLKLSVSPTQPPILSTTEHLVGHSTTNILEEKNQLFNQTVTLSNDKASMLKDLMVETTYGTDQKSTEHNMASYFRLGELSTANTQIRRVLVSSFTNLLQQEKTSTSTQQSGIWQKHSFKFNDGSNIDMSTKNVDGILHVKLAASSQELNRLLINMEQEIKDHLKKELNLELELDFANKDGQSFSDSMQKHTAKNEKINRQNRSNVSNNGSTKELAKNVLPSIRDFGYNQTEWIA